MFYVTEYGSKGTQLDGIDAYFEDVRWAGDMRPGATLEGNMYFLYDGDGDYFISFDNWGDVVELKISVAL